MDKKEKEGKKKKRSKKGSSPDLIERLIRERVAEFSPRVVESLKNNGSKSLLYLTHTGWSKKMVTRLHGVPNKLN
jgi:hypothetical protein